MAIFWIGAAVDFHNTLHRFRSGRGTGTASIEVHLIQKLVDMKEEDLCKVFLDLQKSYDVLNREHCMDILVGCGIRPHTERVLCLYWYHHLMVYRSGK